MCVCVYDTMYVFPSVSCVFFIYTATRASYICTISRSLSFSICTGHLADFHAFYRNTLAYRNIHNLPPPTVSYIYTSFSICTGLLVDFRAFYRNTLGYNNIHNLRPPLPPRYHMYILLSLCAQASWPTSAHSTGTRWPTRTSTTCPPPRYHMYIRYLYRFFCVCVYLSYHTTHTTRVLYVHRPPGRFPSILPEHARLQEYSQPTAWRRSARARRGTTLVRANHQHKLEATRRGARRSVAARRPDW